MNKAEPEYVKVKKSKNYLVWDGAFHAVMDGFTQSFITPYALFLKSSNLVISLLSSMPDLVASVFQLLAIKANEAFRSRKKLIVLSATIQACMWLPILFIPKLFASEKQSLALIALYTCFMMAGYFISPLWKSMVGDLVSDTERGAYFSMRNKIIAAITFASSMIAGFILQKNSADPFVGFTILFATAFATRIISAVFLAAMYEKPVFNLSHSHNYKSYTYTLRRFFKDLNKTDYGKFVLFICLFRVSIALSSPFFSVYELKHLGFTYFQYTILIAIEIVASVLFLGIWGKMNDERGSKSVILYSGLMIPFIPILYLFGANYAYLMAVSLFSGAAWAGFNLGVGNFLFDASNPQERVRYAAYYQLLNGIAIFIGAAGGGLILSALPDTKESLLAIFAVSGIGRLLIAALLFPALKEMRLVEMNFGKGFFKYPMIIKPRHRFAQDPFDYYLVYGKKPLRPRPRLYIDEQFLDQPDPDTARKEEQKVKTFLEKYTPKNPGKDQNVKK